MSAQGTLKTSSDQAIAPLGVDLQISALSAHIATELAAGLSDVPAIRERYGITEIQWDSLKKNPVFRQMVAEAIKSLRGDLNAGARIQKKADIILEDALPAYDRMVHDPTIPAQSRIDAGKLLAQLAGRAAKNDGIAVPGSGFVLNINLGGANKGVTIENAAITDVP
jgi:DNA-binding transcriptional ArsR family regulator